MNKYSKVALFVTFFAIFLSSNAQVKQVFKVIDYDTKKPLQGATSNVFGQSFATNAQGVSVINLGNDKKGAFLPLEIWNLDGYTMLGHTEDCLYQHYQTNDTIKFYMVESKKLTDAQNNMFLKSFDWWYNKFYYENMKEIVDSIKLGDTYYNYSQNLLEYSFSAQGIVQNAFQGVKENNHYEFYNFANEKTKPILDVLNTGNVDSAVKMAKARIDINSTSTENLEKISFYRYLAGSSFSFEESRDSLYKYSEILYSTKKDFRTASKYIYDLALAGKFAESDSIINIEKKNCTDPFLATMFVPGIFKIYFQDVSKSDKITIDEIYSIAKNNNLKYNNFNSKYGLFETYYLPVVHFYDAINDSSNLVQNFDSAQTLLNNFSKEYYKNEYYKNQNLVFEHFRLFQTSPNFVKYIDSAKLAQTTDLLFNALKQIYLEDKSSVANQLWMSDFGLNLARYMEPMSETTIELTNLIFDANNQLSEKYPAMFLIQNVQLSSQLLAKTLMTSTDEKTLKAAFAKYVESFDKINAYLPNCYTDAYLEFNSSVEGFLSMNQIFYLTEELSAFTNHLLDIKSKAEKQDINLTKAKQLNSTAEAFYDDQMYEEAATYYIQAKEYYEKALVNDPTVWKEYLTNYLQLGDAYLFQNQFDRAVVTFQKIYDFESQIPASETANYIDMKGMAHYYIGDAYRMQTDLKTAEKEYKLAEKEFNKAIKMGNIEAYLSLGEMYFQKAVMAAQAKNEKKCYQLLQKSVNFYEEIVLDRPYQQYLRAKVSLKAFNKEMGKSKEYYNNLIDLVDYLETIVYRYPAYAGDLYDVSNELFNNESADNPTKLKCAQDKVDALVILSENGRDVDSYYLSALFSLAQTYADNDSVEKAISLFRDCMNLNDAMYKDTAQTNWKFNNIDIYARIAKCYESMGNRIDTAHSEKWYYKAIDTRDSLIEIWKEFAQDGDENATYRMAIAYRNNALTFADLEMIVSAMDYLEKSNNLLIELYNSEYKNEVEENIIENYFYMYLYTDESDVEKRLQYLRTAFEYIKNSEQLGFYSYMCLLRLENILEDDKSADHKKEIDEINTLIKKMNK